MFMALVPYKPSLTDSLTHRLATMTDYDRFEEWSDLAETHHALLEAAYETNDALRVRACHALYGFCFEMGKHYALKVHGISRF